MPAPEDVTRLLDNLAGGDSGAVNQLLPLVYDELHALAQRQLRAERPDHSLQATALVHEAYLRLVDQKAVQWQNRAHFVAVAATAMRRILVDHARGRARHKRGGDGARERVSLDEALVVAFERDAGLLDLDQALNRLGERSPERARIVEMRFFGGLTVEEIAGVLSTSVSTVNREWRYSRAWLYRELGGKTAGSGAREGSDAD
jgi:RNA polymerase sigma-70 factor (ECF subfamily)